MNCAMWAKVFLAVREKTFGFWQNGSRQAEFSAPL
jgi:hypothetical protein